jgi:hypothetical protein
MNAEIWTLAAASALAAAQLAAQSPIERAASRHGMIFVTAAHSGNSAYVFDRREPSALLAAGVIATARSVELAAALSASHRG